MSAMAKVHIKLLGLFRLDTGLHELDAEGERVRDLYPVLLKRAREVKPDTTVTQADLEGCIILVNGKQVKKNMRLSDGDSVHLMSPVCGG